jgi:hypothetical protein
MDRKQWDTTAGAILLVGGIVVAAVGASLVWYENWRHMIEPPVGRR